MHVSHCMQGNKLLKLRKLVKKDILSTQPKYFLF
jgi:hypothetical protein